MKTMNVTPMTIAQYEHDHVDVVAKCKKAISKFINTYLVLGEIYALWGRFRPNCL